MTVESNVSLEHQWNRTDRGKLKYSWKTLPQCYFLYHKSHTNWPGIERGVTNHCVMARPACLVLAPFLNEECSDLAEGLTFSNKENLISLISASTTAAVARTLWHTRSLSAGNLYVRVVPTVQINFLHRKVQISDLHLLFRSRTL
jgi:hypothetical protein